MESTEFILEAFRQYNSSHNYRQSAIREAVLLELWNCSEDIDADTLFWEMRRNGKKIKLGSIYNTLRWLTQAGFLQKTNFSRKATYRILKQRRTELMRFYLLPT